MAPYTRSYPGFALCGLNCAICPRHHTNGPSACPGCGGKRFNELHPTCPIITCSKHHENVEFCHECASYPCERYRETPGQDSFITYLSRLDDQRRAQEIGIERYCAELEEKLSILNLLLDTYDDGKHKGFFCLAVNLLSLQNLRSILVEMKSMDLSTPKRELARLMKQVMTTYAGNEGVELHLRKTPAKH